LIVLVGIDPLKITVLSMAFTSATLPVTTIPFLVLMNDRDYVKEAHNSLVGNTVLVLIILLVSVVAIVTIPLEVLGG
jgi:Mn2+/Fe2+ NRAMP family transporter